MKHVNGITDTKPEMLMASLSNGQSNTIQGSDFNVLKFNSNIRHQMRLVTRYSPQNKLKSYENGFP